MPSSIEVYLGDNLSLMRELEPKWQQRRWGIKTYRSNRLMDLRFADDLLLLGRDQTVLACAVELGPPRLADGQRLRLLVLLLPREDGEL